MSKSRPYVVSLSMPGQEPGQFEERTFIINARSLAQARQHALGPYQPLVTDCRPVPALEMAKLIHKGVPFQDATDDPELKEEPLDMSKLGGGESGE